MKIIVSEQHQAMLLPAVPAMQTLFPEAVPLNGTQLVVPHGTRECILLRRAGHHVPNPLLSYYDWAGGTPFAVQKITAALFTANPRSYSLSDPGCVDANTEYLAEDGWHRIAEYKSGKVAQYHPASGEIEFVKPAKYVKQPCKEMIRFKTARGVDQLLSPEHRVLLANGLVVSAENLEQFYNSSSRSTKRILKFRTTFSVIGRPGLSLTPAQIQVQVAVNADGYIPRPANKTVYMRLKKERKKIRLRNILKAAKISYTEKPCAPEGFTRFVFKAPMQKGFTRIWWNATQTQLNIVAKEAVHWDGTARKARGCGFYSNIKTDADFIQYAYSASGCRTSVSKNNRGEYTVHASHCTDVAGLYSGRGNQFV